MTKIVEVPTVFTDSGFQQLMVSEGEFNGIVFSYRDVQISEVSGNGVLSFTYVVHSGEVPRVLESKFKNMIGDYLFSRLDQMMLKGEIIYANGVDD